MSIFSRFGKWVKKNVQWLVLLPFKPMMKRELRKKGVNTKHMKLGQIALAFHSHHIAKPNGLEGYDHLDSDDLGEDVVASIIKEIINFLKNLFHHVKAGLEHKLSEGERRIAHDVDKVMGNLHEKSKREIVGNYHKLHTGRRRMGIFGNKKNMIVMLVVLGLVAYLLFKK
jgi:hypothetical protein